MKAIRFRTETEDDGECVRAFIELPCPTGKCKDGHDITIGVIGCAVLEDVPGAYERWRDMMLEFTKVKLRVLIENHLPPGMIKMLGEGAEVVDVSHREKH